MHFLEAVLVKKASKVLPEEGRLAGLAPASDPARSRRRRSPRTEPFLTPDDWIREARNLLIEEGVDNISIEKLAQNLKVTRGSFYWHFAGRQELLDELLNDWEESNTKAFVEVDQQKERDGDSAFNAISDIWLDETAYDPRYDSAIRQWARTNADVANVVRRVDEKRIKIFQHIFTKMGYSKRRAMIRARVTYFTQVGYYILGLQETKRQRQALRPLYFEVFTGHEDPGDKSK